MAAADPAMDAVDRAVGVAVYRGDKFPAWNGDIFVGALAFNHLRRVDLDV